MNKSRKKLMFLIPSLEAGGAEKVITTIVNNLDRSKFDITLVLLQKQGKYLKDILSDIDIIDLNVKKVRYSVFKIIFLVWKLKPDIVFSTLGHMNLIMAILKPFLPKKIKLIGRETRIVSISNKSHKNSSIMNFLIKFFYKRFDILISQSNDMKDDLLNKYSINSIVINNPIEVDKVIALSDKETVILPKNKYDILAIGRLTRQKGFDLLLQAVSELNIDYHLTILGKGIEEKNLKNLVKKLKIEERVTFTGFVENPYSYLKQSDLFVLSSRHEGFPNVVLEAHSCAIPVVAFSCPGGLNEIIIDGVNGFLVKNGDINSLTNKIKQASSYKFTSSNILESSKNRYDINLIIKKYEKTFT